MEILLRIKKAAVYLKSIPTKYISWCPILQEAQFKPWFSPSVLVYILLPVKISSAIMLGASLCITSFPIPIQDIKCKIQTLMEIKMAFTNLFSRNLCITLKFVSTMEFCHLLRWKRKFIFYDDLVNGRDLIYRYFGGKISKN